MSVFWIGIALNTLGSVGLGAVLGYAIAPARGCRHRERR